MKKITNKLLFAAILLFSQGSMAGIITWNSTANDVNSNEIFSLNIIGTGFAEIVDGGGIDLSFDASVLEVLSVTIDTAVWNFFPVAGPVIGTIDNVAGTVNGIAVNALPSTITGDFIVATIQFQAVGLFGTNSALTLSEYAINPWASGGSVITPLNFVNGNVSVVPVPAAAWLFGSGLLALMSVARRKRVSI